ncbi:MAG TPA: hypothetical protein DF383_08835, partial [Deltaproteobacteria bacterium]|nr:hypothetical protein [Deltaproteobacteria bacterium]
NINAYINCDAVLTSRYASLGTIPLGGMGLLFYIYLLGSLLYARIAPENSASILYLPWLLCMVAI